MAAEVYNPQMHNPHQYKGKSTIQFLGVTIMYNSVDVKILYSCDEDKVCQTNLDASSN